MHCILNCCEVKLDPKYEKAHYRVVFAMIEMEQYKKACVCLLNAFNEIGDNDNSKSISPLRTLEAKIK